jgi:hypothetical protein
MSRSKPSAALGLVSLILWSFAAACGTDRHESHDAHGGAIWFVHATDPHIYKDPIPDTAAITDPDKKKTQKLDEEALTALFEKIPELPQTYGRPAFLLITGDFGVDPCQVTNPPVPASNKDPRICLAKDRVDDKIRKAQIQNLAALLAKSPVRDIYFVAGNNDLPREAATKDALKYFNDFFEGVQAKLKENNSDVQLVNLTSCYVDPQDKTGCYIDVPKTDYTVIGFPSQSFKNRDGADPDANSESMKLEAPHVAQFLKILDEVVGRRRKVLVVTHIPELDDPYLVGLDLYGKKDALLEPGARINGSKPGVSAWNVTDKVLEDWKNAVSSDSVTAVFAGHLHDSHKEVYRRPYSWSPQIASRIALEKLYLAPPLSLKKQETSVIQARGFTTVTLFPDAVQQRFYWYDSPSKMFTPDPLPESARAMPSSWSLHPPRWFLWMWELDRSDGPLERATVLLVGLLTAFLTLIAVWQIPPTDSPLANKSTSEKDKNNETKGVAPSSPFTHAFAKVVIAGVGGLLFADIAKELSGQSLSNDAKYLYIVCFVIFFLLLLLVSSGIRAFAEALRSRVTVYPVAPGGAKLGRAAIAYWFQRGTHWFFSLRVPLLTFIDTFINLIQGRNQTTTKAFADIVVAQQMALVRTADAIRKNLNDLIESRVRKDRNPSQFDDPPIRVRVNLSVLSNDQTRVFYVSRTQGSSVRPFSKRSVAWVSVFTGQIRWFDSRYRQALEDIILFDNRKGIIPDTDDRLMLSSHYQDRQDDYEAFVILPIPYPQRAYGTNYVKGAIQISFGSEIDFHAIWSEEETGPRQMQELNGKKFQIYPDYPQNMLDAWCKSEGVRAALKNSIAALSELYRAFNEVIYQTEIEPNRVQ